MTAAPIPAPDQGHGRDDLRAYLDTNVARGELPASTDVDVVVDVLHGSFLYRRLITGAPVDADCTARLVDFARR